MISSRSRYANSKLVTQTVKGKDVIYVTPSPAVSFTFQYSYYIIDGSDRIDNIASAFIGDPTQWYTIGSANPEIMQWFSVPPGTIVRIPKVSVSS
jgi:hypothetical protein